LLQRLMQFLLHLRAERLGDLATPPDQVELPAVDPQRQRICRSGSTCLRSSGSDRR
jgi:hypothetical protein